MASNSFKQVRKENTFSLFSIVEKVIGKESMLNNGISAKIVPVAAYLIVIGLFYIGITHFAERMIRDYDHLKQEVDDLRTDWTTLKADYMFSSKQSEVAKRVKNIGLFESKQPPFKIIDKKD